MDIVPHRSVRLYFLSASVLLTLLLLSAIVLSCCAAANAAVNTLPNNDDALSLSERTYHSESTTMHPSIYSNEGNSNKKSEFDSESERSILMDLWSSTQGPNWLNTTNWNTNITVCNWHGVTCDAGNQRIIKLSLSGNNLVGFLPSSLANLTALQELSVRLNDISGPLPRWLCSSLQMTIIDLAYTQVSGPMLDCWQTGAQLLELNFENLALFGPLPPSVGNLQNLSILDFRGTQLTGLIPDTWQHLTLLTRLLLSSPLQSPLPSWLGTFTHLLDLLVNNAQLQGELPKEIGNLINLQRLDLSNNPGITGNLPPEFGNLTSLRTLLFTNTGVSGEIPGSFTQLNNLTVLSLDFTRLTGNPFPSLPINLMDLSMASSQFLAPLDDDFCKLTQLKMFVTSSSRGMGGPIPHCISRMTQLASLYLDHCDYYDPLPVELFSLVQLKNLNLFSNALRGSIPDEIGQLTQLTQVEFGDNYFNGTIPSTVSRLTRLTYFGAATNKLSGDFDLLSFTTTSPFVVDLAANNLTFSSLAQCAAAARSIAGYTGNVLSITQLILDQNPINLPLSDVMKCFASATPMLVTLLLQSNGLYGGLTQADIAHAVSSGGAAQLAYSFQSLVTISVLNNLLDSVSVVNTLVEIGTLIIVDASANQMVGSIADSAFRIQRLILSNNPYLLGVPSNDFAVPGWGPKYLPPAFVSVDETNLIRNDTLSLLCPALVGTTGQEFLVDPSYLNWQHCHCLSGYRTTAPDGNYCVPCPAELSGSNAMYAPVHAVSNGFYPYPLPLGAYDNDSSLLLSNAVMIPCQYAQRCNPDTQSQYQCANGSDPNSLLCSRCLDGFFEAEGACHQCASWARWVVPVILVLAAAGFLLIQITILATEERSKRAVLESSSADDALSLPVSDSVSSQSMDGKYHHRDQSSSEAVVDLDEKDSSTSTLLIILTFWLQSQNTLASVSGTGSTSSSDNSGHGFMHYISSTANLTPLGLECVVDGWNWPSQWWLTVLSPVWMVMLAAFIYVTGRLQPIQARLKGWLNMDNAASTSIAWRRMSFRLLLSLWSLTYMGVAQMILSSWRCESVSAPDPANNFSFLTAAPYVTCGSPQHVKMLAVGIMMFTLFTLALPAMMLWYSWKQRRNSASAVPQVTPSSSFQINGREMKLQTTRATAEASEHEHALGESLLSPSMKSDIHDEANGLVQPPKLMHFDLQFVLATTACMGLRTSCWQWQSIITGRKLLLASIVALTPRGSSIAPLLVIMMLLTLLLSHTWIRPFQVHSNVFDYNLLEACLLLQVSALFLAQVLSAAAGAQQQLLQAGASLQTQAGVVPTLLDRSALEVAHQIILGIGIGFVSIAVMQAAWRMYQKRQKSRAAGKGIDNITVESQL